MADMYIGRDAQGREGAEQERATQRRRGLTIGGLLLVCAAVALSAWLATRSPGHRAGTSVATRSQRRSSPIAMRPSSYAVGLRVLRFVDHTRKIEPPSGKKEPRVLLTYVRYPAVGAATRVDLHNAPAARSDGPFPLVVFGHGFGVTPALYARLLQAWVHAGFVVAAPLFPLENRNAPGGPDESDLVNQPADMRFVISRLLATSGASAGPLAGLIDPRRIAVTGQSDGGDTALAVAFDPRFRDRRVGAAIILSGAEIPAEGSFMFPTDGPPLLATQGTADTINAPAATDTFFEAAQRPKYLLSLLGAEHLPPYFDELPQLTVVEHVTTAFLYGFLDNMATAVRDLPRLGNVPNVATLLAEP
jgi:dienelactone hydrolase